MIKRELYMSKIRPFFDKPVVKVLTGIRRCGKSVMLELIKDELIQNGAATSQLVSINFESKAVDYVKSAELTYRHNKKSSLQSKKTQVVQ